MRWTTFAVLLYAFSIPAATNLLTLGGASSYPRIEYLVLLAVFYGLYASDDGAPLAALWCGLVMDLLRSQILGTYALPLALVGWALVKIRMSVFREHMIAQLMITILAVIGSGLLVALWRWLLAIPALSGLPNPYGWDYLLQNAASALYTGVVAPLVFWLLFRLEPILGFGIKGARSR